jgi:5-methylcytosine-specific restriction endonuclease McrA
MRPLTDAQRRYEAYLQTPHWQAKRARILERAEEHCERCGRFGGLNPHGAHVDEDLICCGEADCAFCRWYFDDEGLRNDAELQQLEVHHRTYVRRGWELDTDLVALCWGCHEDTWDRDVSTSDTILDEPTGPVEETVF